MNAFEFARKLEKITPEVIRKIAGESIVENNKEVTDSIKGQLWDGKKGDGQNITPSYLDDPFFETKEKAIAYRNWKNSITKNSNRDPDTPNLFINGYFYDTLFVDSGSFEVASNSFGNPIIEKYGRETFSIDSKRDDNKEVFSNLRKSFIQKLKALWQMN
jgi:hypothetical protein